MITSSCNQVKPRILISFDGNWAPLIHIVWSLTSLFKVAFFKQTNSATAFYNAINEVQAKTGFILIGYVLPPDVDQTMFKKQYVAIYDSIDYPN